MRVYLAAPTRGVPAPEGSVEAIRAALIEAGHEVVNELRGPGDKAVVHAQDTRAFIVDTDRMLGADLLIAEASTPSHGVGWAAAWFLAKGRLVILCCHSQRRAHLSALMGGNPSPWQKLVVYEDLDDLAAKLATILKR